MPPGPGYHTHPSQVLGAASRAPAEGAATTLSDAGGGQPAARVAEVSRAD